ncbi:hypothetical protein ACFL6G_10300 [candidate division KSB1 bacterium]
MIRLREYDHSMSVDADNIKHNSVGAKGGSPDMKLVMNIKKGERRFARE